ncbi:hypothetical protein TGCAST_390090, partial [Toxoplasma gondii CAST]
KTQRVLPRACRKQFQCRWLVAGGCARPSPPRNDHRGRRVPDGGGEVYWSPSRSGLSAGRDRSTCWGRSRIHYSRGRRALCHHEGHLSCPNAYEECHVVVQCVFEEPPVGLRFQEWEVGSADAAQTVAQWLQPHMSR